MPTFNQPAIRLLHQLQPPRLHLLPGTQPLASLSRESPPAARVDPPRDPAVWG